MASDSVEYIRLKNQINIELRQVMTEVDDLAKTHVHEMERKGAKMTLEEVNARKEVMASIISEHDTWCTARSRVSQQF